MLVITATAALTMLVQSHVPPRPTSTTATSTASSANQVRAAAVSSSKRVGGSSIRLSMRDSVSSRSVNVSSSIGSPLRARRSLTRDRLGLVYVPTCRPRAASSEVTMAAVEPLPLVPVMWITG